MRALMSFVAVLALLSGCASVVPEAIRSAPPGEVQIAEAGREPETFRGVTVRWGGSVVAVRNLENETLVELVGRRLDSDGRPRDEDQTEGRFLAKVAGFLDPAIYAPGRKVTVRGRLEGVVEQPIGEFRYTYPIVRAEQIYLWEPRAPTPPSYPYYYDPFWRDPWYPWGYPYSPYYRPWYR